MYSRGVRVMRQAQTVHVALAMDAGCALQVVAPQELTETPLDRSGSLVEDRSWRHL